MSFGGCKQKKEQFRKIILRISFAYGVEANVYRNEAQGGPEAIRKRRKQSTDGGVVFLLFRSCIIVFDLCILSRCVFVARYQELVKSLNTNVGRLVMSVRLVKIRPVTHDLRAS